MIGRIWTLGWSGALQLLRSRIYLNLIVAGLALIGAALVFDRLSAGMGGRVFVDIGLAFSALVVSLLVTVTGIGLITRDIETRQVHLVLARPITRSEIVIGRYITLLLLAWVSQLILGLVMVLASFFVEDVNGWRLLGACLFQTFEAVIVAALVLIFGTTSSSTISALFVTTIFILGRLTPTIEDLINKQKFSPGTQEVLEVVHAVLPHLNRFDLTLWARNSESITFEGVAVSILYALLYSAGLLAISTFRFNRRDVL